MASGSFELIGVEAVVAGIASFERDAASVNRLLQQIGRTTDGLASGSTSAFSIVGNVATTAFSAIVTGAAAATTALAGLSIGAVQVAASFEQNILRAAAVTGTSADNITALGQAAIKAGNDSRLGLSEIADAENQLARSGFSATDITNGLLEATTKFSEASGGRLGAAQAANLMSEVLKAYGLSADNAARVSNSLTAAVNSSVIQYGDLSIILRQVAPIAASLNIPIEDLSAAVGVLGQAGISGSVAGSALKDVLVRLADPSKQGAAELKKFGITIQDANGNILPFREIVQLMSKDLSDNAVAAGKVTEAQREQALAVLFGTRGIEAGLALVRGGTKAFDDLRNSIENTNVARIADDMRNSLIPQLDRLRNIVQGLIIDFGTPLEQALTKSLIKVNDFLSGLDPRIPELFGQALLTIFNGLNASTVKFDFTKLLGPTTGGIFSGLLDDILAVRSAIIDDIIPAFRVLFDTITGGNSPTVALGSALEQVAGIITTLGKDIATAVEYVAAFITVIRDFGVIIGIIGDLKAKFDELYDSISKNTPAVKDVTDALKALVATLVISFLLDVTIQVTATTIALIRLAIAIRETTAAYIQLTIISVAPFIAANAVLIGAILAVIAAIAILYLAWTNDWLGIREAVTSAVSTVSPALSVLAGIIRDVLLVALGIIVVYIRAVITEFNNLKAGIDIIVAAFRTVDSGAILNTIAQLIDLQTELRGINIVAQAVSNAWATIWTGIGGVVQIAVRFIIDRLTEFFDTIDKIPLVRDALDKLGGAFTGLRDTGSTAVNDLTKQITDATARQKEAFDNLLVTANTDFTGISSAILGFANSAISSYGAVITATRAVEEENARLAASYRFIPSQEQTQTSIAQNYERQSGLARALPPTSPGAYIPPSFVPPGAPIAPPGGGGGSTAIKSITLELERMLRVLPGNTKALADFLNQLNQITPGRGLQLANDLIKARDQIVAIRDEYGRVLAIQQAQVVVQEDINKITAQQNVIALEAESETLGYRIQINSLEQQTLAIKQQELPIEQAISVIDQQIAALQQTNFATEQASLQNQLAQARIQAQILPTQQKIADIEKQITDSVDQRTLLLEQQQELGQNKAVDTTQFKLDQVQQALKAAFNNKDYTQVIALEQQQYALEQTLGTQKDQLKLIQDKNKLTTDDNNITANNLKLQEQGYIDSIKPLENQLFLLQQQGALIDANGKIAQLQTQIQINALNQQKAALEAILVPLKQQTLDIQGQRDALQLEIDKITAQKDAQKLQLDAKLLGDKLELESLKTLQTQEQARFEAIVFGFVNAQVASGAFTEAEAANVIKVLGFWDSEIAKTQDLIDKFGSEKAAAQAVVDTIALIKDKTVTITIKYVTEGSPTGTFQYGGTVPGPVGKPQLIIAHGGEQFLGVGNTISPAFAQRTGIGNSAQQVNNYYNNYELNATYKQQESPANIGMDLRALTAMTSR